MTDAYARKFPTDTPLKVVTPENISQTALLLSQTTPQKVTGGAPQFDAGITIKKDQPIYLDGI